jgi:UDP-N-acetylglucosamine transferase subunit ALG13
MTDKTESLLARFVGTVKGDDLLAMDPDLSALVEEYHALTRQAQVSDDGAIRVIDVGNDGSVKYRGSLGLQVSDDAEVEQLRAKMRMIISHASGGHLSKPEDIDRPTNDIAVEISRHNNRIWEHAQEAALRDAATNSEAVSELVRADLERIVQMRPRNSNRVTTAHLMASRAEIALAKLGSRAP